jgi:predicted nucleotidyltransferase
MDIQFSDTDKEKLSHLGIAALIIFGSQAQGIAREGSDYDFGVLVQNIGILRDSKRRSALYSELYDILSGAITQLVNIDIVFLADAPAELQMHVVNHGVPVYEDDPNAFLRFKERAMLSYADFAPYRELFHRMILARIAP